MARGMSGPRKAAILLLSMGEDAAAEVLKNLTEDEVREVTRHMAQFGDITPEDVDRVAHEFYRVAQRGHFLPTPPETKADYLRKLLGRALGEERAGEIVDGLTQSGGGRIEQLKWHDPATIAEFLAPEHPQVIAVILANLGDPSLAQEVLDHFPDDRQEDLYARLARLKTVSPEMLQEIEASLEEEMAPRTGPAAEGDADGSGKAAAALGAGERSMEEALIDHLESRDPALAERIRKRLFNFQDLLKIDNRGTQLVLRNISGDDLVRALKLADDSVKRHLYRNMSRASVERIEEAMEALGPQAIGEVEAAQRRIAGVARQLIEQGEIFPLERRPRSERTEPAGDAGTDEAGESG